MDPCGLKPIAFQVLPQMAREERSSLSTTRGSDKLLVGVNGQNEPNEADMRE